MLMSAKSSIFNNQELIHEAERAVKAEEMAAWLGEVKQ
jgi:hypothetical protein